MKVIEISDILDNKHTLQALLDLDQIWCVKQSLIVSIMLFNW